MRWLIAHQTYCFVWPNYYLETILLLIEMFSLTNAPLAACHPGLWSCLVLPPARTILRSRQFPVILIKKIACLRNAYDWNESPWWEMILSIDIISLIQFGALLSCRPFLGALSSVFPTPLLPILYALIDVSNLGQVLLEVDKWRRPRKQNNLLC